MEDQEINEVKRIFLQAIELPPDGREDFLKTSCGSDAELRAKVDSLLSRYGSQSDFLSDPIGDLLLNVPFQRSGDTSPPEIEPGLPHERIGEYRLIKRLGGGGMGEVYLGIQEPLGRKVALKTLRADRAGSIEATERFRREIEAVSRLNHPNIVTVYGCGEELGVRYYAMEYIAGYDMNEALRFASGKKQPIPIRQVADWVLQVARALDHSHASGIIHRDVKPSNIRITEDNTAKLMDFGVSRQLELESITLTGVFRGTPHYASPEQIDSKNGKSGASSDVYSLAVTLYEGITGRTPFMGETTEQVFRQILEAEPVPPRRLNADIPRDLETVVLKAMQKDPKDRYASMVQFANDLECFLNGTPVMAKPLSPARRIIKLAGKSPALSIAASIAFVAVVSWLLFGPVLYFKMIDERDSALFAQEESERLSNQLEEGIEKAFGLVFDLKQLSDLEDEQKALLKKPAQDVVTQMKAWIDKVQPYVDISEKRSMELEAHRRNALPYDDDAKRLDKESHPEWGMIELLEARLGEIRTDIAGLDEADSAMKIRRLREREAKIARRIEETTALVNKRRTWKYETFAMQWRNDVLADLVAKLELFANPETGYFKRTNDRLLFAGSVDERSLVEHGEEWNEAIASIGNDMVCPAYIGFNLKPQIGLVPIGQDPQSGLWEFAHLQTGDIPERNSDGKLEITEQTGVVLVLVPGGSFLMGAWRESEEHPIGEPNVNPWAKDDEGPVHEVSVQPYFISKYEMTQGQWYRIAYSNPSRYGPEEKYGEIKHSLRHPVECVNWSECDEVLTSCGLRLPSEAEWENAIKAESSTIFWTSDLAHDLDGACNIADLSFKNDGRFDNYSTKPETWLDDHYALHSPVGSFRANHFGLHDMCGNVTEWCKDSFVHGYGLPGMPTDGSAYLSNAIMIHVVRGGNYEYPVSCCRSTYRNYRTAGSGLKILGVRPAKSIEG